MLFKNHTALAYDTVLKDSTDRSIIISFDKEMWHYPLAPSTAPTLSLICWTENGLGRK